MREANRDVEAAKAAYIKIKAREAAEAKAAKEAKEARDAREAREAKEAEGERAGSSSGPALVDLLEERENDAELLTLVDPDVVRRFKLTPEEEDARTTLAKARANPELVASGNSKIRDFNKQVDRAMRQHVERVEAYPDYALQTELIPEGASASPETPAQLAELASLLEQYTHASKNPRILERIPNLTNRAVELLTQKEADVRKTLRRARLHPELVESGNRKIRDHNVAAATLRNFAF
jgi:hypothetical protein